mmetsp:Transcript_2128/g.7067  ORF Transcript_2128/g.7067 Transcript_2128/m.7067 type:complete len:82 (-) Transcript_2128:1091-1336(-)
MGRRGGAALLATAVRRARCVVVGDGGGGGARAATATRAFGRVVRLGDFPWSRLEDVEGGVCPEIAQIQRADIRSEGRGDVG